MSNVQDTVTGLLQKMAETNPHGVATRHRIAKRGWVSTTWSALWAEVERLASEFRRAGFGKGDRLAILARTCREWQIAEMAALRCGGVVVGIDAHATAEQAAWMMEHSDACALVVDTRENLEKARAHSHQLKFILLLDPAETPSGMPLVLRWQDVALRRADAATATWGTASPGDPAALIYTSGTTGQPKAIEYTHGQLMLAARSILAEFPDLGGSEAVLCWLPMAPLFQRMMNLVACISGATTYFVEDPRQIMDHVRDVKPTVFVAVPRFYEKLHDGIREQCARARGWRRRLIERALSAGAQRSRHERSGIRVPWRLRITHAMLDLLVLRRVRGVMGGRVRWMISGSAPLAPWLLEFFHSLGLLVLEAYGLSENTVPIAANRPHAYRFGSVGRPFAANTIRLAEDGELLVSGPGLFRSYHREGRPVDRFTLDGMYRTGDYARLDEDGFLFLVGRQSELIKTSTGRRISPAQIEAVYRQSPYVDHVVVVGNNRKHLAALVTLNVPALVTEAERAGIDLPAGAALAKLPFVNELIGREFEAWGRQLAPHERVRAFAILPEPLSIATGELTSSLKLRRDRIEERHRELVERLYGSGAGHDGVHLELADPRAR